MFIERDELDRLHAKYPYPRFSDAEYERRYANVRGMMRDKDLDCLLVIGGSASYGRLWFNVRYLTNMMAKAEMAYYCFFPKEGNPAIITRPGHALAPGMIARSVVQELVVGRPNVLDAIVGKVREMGYDKGRIGIVEYDPFTSIPKNHWDFFVSELPDAEFVFVTKEFLALKLYKSDEEIEALRKSALVQDIGLRALADQLKPGMTESEAFAIVYEAVVRNGGEMGMIQLSSTPMRDSDVGDQRPRPSERVITHGDIINNELGILHNGYEAQTGKPMFIGPPTDEFRRMFDVALEAYHRVAETLKVGGTGSDSVNAANSVIKPAGYDAWGGYLQGMLGAQPRHEPQIGPELTSLAEDKLFEGDEMVFKNGTVFVLQIHLVDKERTKGLFIGDTYAMRDSGTECLNDFPPELIQIS